MRYDALRRGYVWGLTFEEWVALVSENCFICDKEPSQVFRYRPGSPKELKIRYSGIDRIDNRLGYEWDNSVPCCPVCNKIKSAEGDEEE